MVLFGSAISDPIALLSRIEGVWAIAAALVGLVLATLTTNLAANVVAPSNVSLRSCQASGVALVLVCLITISRCTSGWVLLAEALCSCAML